MKKINNKIDVFCYKHPRFGIPNLMMYIVIISLAVLLLTMMDRTGALIKLLAFSPELILKGQVWRLFTFIFIPQSLSLWSLLFFYFYYWIGSALEREWGTPRFNIFLISGILLTAIYGFIVYFITGVDAAVDTYYVFLSMFFSFATLYPDVQVLFMFIIPVKVKWLAYIDAAFFAYAVFANPFPFNLLPIIAILNYLVFFGAELFEALGFGRRKYRKATINFNREKARIKYEQKNADYTYKCSVCGRTDRQYPELEFRYCSRCAGYHCFCEEHINTHIHFTE